MNDQPNQMPEDTAAPQPLQRKIPDQLNQAMAVVDMKTWIATATILIVLIAVCIWAFFGTMQLKQNVSGVMVRNGRNIVIYSPEDSVLLDLSIARDQQVQRDQVIARLDQPALVDNINAMIEAGAPEGDIELARAELLRKSQVLTYDEGRIQDIFVRVGDHIGSGQKMATLIQSPPKGQNIKCLMYVPMDQMHTISKGMSLNIYPDFADKNTYGNMVGTIADISQYPASENYLLDELGSPELASALTGGKACFELSISLLTSEDTTTGYYWTTSKGPATEIGDVSLCTAEIILSAKRPVDVFFFNK